MTRMTPAEIRNTVHTLQAQGRSLREISRLLALSRNTVRRILRQPGRTVDQAAPCDGATLARLKAAFERARGNVVRVQELLADDGLDVRYSTLTRWVREAALRAPPRRAGEYDFAPGQEMQHDTSPRRSCSRQRVSWMASARRRPSIILSVRAASASGDVTLTSTISSPASVVAGKSKHDGAGLP